MIRDKISWQASFFMKSVFIPIFSINSACAVQSGSTGQIQGRAPTISGDLQVLYPDGKRIMAYNGTLSLTYIPEKFSVSSDVTALTAYDADGDTGLHVQVHSAEGSLNWLFNDIPLTQNELTTSLGNSFTGKTLTLVVSAPVTVTSASGLPTTEGPLPHTSVYTISVPSYLPSTARIAVNNTTFLVEQGFPTTGFGAAFFDFLMDGSSTDTNGNYRWASDQSWVAVSSNGRVTLLRQPAEQESNMVMITAEERDSDRVLEYHFTVGKWFTNMGSSTMNQSDADEFCRVQRQVLPLRTELTSGTMARGIGSLFAEWGPMNSYSGADFVGTYYWTSEQSNSTHYFTTDLTFGMNMGMPAISENHLVCSQNL
ncbi:TPA: hypothetical protein OTT35_000042 [Citrobacter koseri]|nr:hypothetical protein [Citrobacter koseri]